MLLSKELNWSSKYTSDQSFCFLSLFLQFYHIKLYYKACQFLRECLCQKHLPHLEIVLVLRNCKKNVFSTLPPKKRGNKSFRFTPSSLPPVWESSPLGFPTATVPPHNVGNKLSTSLHWPWHWQAVVLQDSLVAAMGSTCLQYPVYGMTNWVETGSPLNTEDDAVGVCNWFLLQEIDQMLPSLI